MNTSETIMAKPQPATPIYHGRKWPVGLHNAAKRLGCSPGHLFQVLKGNREGQRIKDGYKGLVAELKGGAA